VGFTTNELEQSIGARFERQVQQYPDRLALRTRTETYTYAGLNQAANRVADALLGLRGQGQETVALLFDNGASFVVASLGVLKAGKIQVPLESAFPRARLRYMLEQSEAAALVTDNTNLPLAQEFVPRALINIEALDDRFSSANPGVALAPDAYAAVEYTSGSTGRPKGIVRNHRGVLHTVMHLTNTCRISLRDRLIVPRASMRNHLYALLNGAAAYPVTFGQDEPRQLADWLTQEDITIFRTVVSAFRGFASALTGTETFPDLRLILVFGEPVYPSEVGLYRTHFPEQCLFASSLGCSEFGDYAYFFVDKETPLPSGPVPGGYPIAGTEILLLDDDGAPVGGDHIGELAVRSRFGAVGYWRRPDLTHAAFLSDPAGDDVCIYRTGDLGRRGPDGCLFHLGRKDFQVKIRGHRVEVAEVETALLDIEGVKEAVVVGHEATPGEKRLVAYLVPAGHRAPTVTALRRLLADKLPAYMVPSTFVTLETLPLTATGKVDRRALPPPDGTRPTLDTPYVAPRSPLEEWLATTWAEVLGLDRVGRDDNFLDLGGQSLMATMLVSRVLAHLHVRLSPRTLLDAPTVAAMAEVLVRSLPGGMENEALDQTLAEVEGLSEEEARSLLDRESS
jgi:amino acid adenylation domain-containing protein